MNYLAASTNAVLMTFNGSTIPASIMFTYSPDTSKEERFMQIDTSQPLSQEENYSNANQQTRTMLQTTLFALVYLLRREDKPVAASYPRSGSFCSNSLPTTTAPSTPALEAIVYAGICSQCRLKILKTDNQSSITFFQANPRTKIPPHVTFRKKYMRHSPI